MNDVNHSSQDSFFKTFRECLLSFSFDIAGLLAGVILASQTNIFSFSPWIIIVYPAILSARGMIGGIFTGRLSTALHVGIIYPKFIGNTKAFHKLFEAIIVTTLMTSLFMSLTAIVFGFLLWGISITDFLSLVLFLMGTMALGLTISLITIIVSFVSFKRGLDPDVVVYPIMSTTADIMITVFYVITATLFFLFGEIGRNVIVVIDASYLILSSFILLRNIHNREFINDIKEVLLTLIIVAFIVNFTGTFLGKISAIVKNRREVYTIYPALIDTIGDVGSVVGSVVTTRLALGFLNPSLIAIGRIKRQILGSWLASIIIFISLSFLSLLLNGVLEASFLISFTYILLITNVIAIPIIVIISYTISILAFKGGFDPDNFVIPIESSLADNVTTIALFVAILLH